MVKLAVSSRRIEATGKSESAAERAVRKLRQAGRFKRIGPAKGGH